MLTLILCAGMLWSQSLIYEIKIEYFDNAFTVNSLTQAINYNTGGSSSIQVCEGEQYDLLEGLEYGSAHDSRMLSRCEKYIGSRECDGSKYNIVSSNGVEGPIVLLNDNEMSAIKEWDIITGYNSLSTLQKSVFDKVCSLNGGADLSMGYNHITYADVDAGLGCKGEYKIYVNNQLKKTGDLSNIQSDSYTYAFDHNGTVKYETYITECAGLMKEYFDNDGTPGLVVHPFWKKTYGNLPKVAEKEYDVEVIPNNRVEIEEDGTVAGTIVCGSNGICVFEVDALTEGVSSSVSMYLSLTNTGDTDVRVTSLNIESLSSYVPIESYEFSAILPFVLEVGETKTIMITVHSTPLNGASANNPHPIKVTYDYIATNTNPCTNLKEEGSEEYTFNIIVKSEQTEGTGLLILPSIRPQNIDDSNYQSVNENGVSINGTVSILPNNEIPWDAATSTGAAVTIENIEKYECNRNPPHLCMLAEDCLSSPVNTETDSEGKFDIDINNLECAINSDDNGFLLAHINAVYNNLQGTNTSKALINVYSPDMQCRVIVDNVERSPTQETYDFEVRLINRDDNIMDIPNEFSFDCGDGHGLRNGDDWSGEHPQFTCTYDIEDTSEATKSAMFEMQYEKAGMVKTVTCSAYANICGVYLG